MFWFLVFVESESVKNFAPYKNRCDNLNLKTENGGFSNRIYWDISSSKYQWKSVQWSCKLRNISQNRHCTKKWNFPLRISPANLFTFNTGLGSVKRECTDQKKSYCDIFYGVTNMPFLPAGQLFHDGGPYRIETSPLICKTNQFAKQINGLVSIWLGPPLWKN